MNSTDNTTGGNARSSMDLEGRFTSAENLAEIIRNLSVERLTGTLILRCGNTATDFHFHYGMLTGSGNPDRPRRLGQILLNRGVVDRAGLEEGLSYQADFAPSTPIGRVLVHRERITEEELCSAVQLQLEEEIGDILSHGDGFYQFKSEPVGEAPPQVELDPSPIIDDVLSRRDDWKRIREKVSNDTMIPAVVKLSEPADRETMHLNSREWHILSLVNGYYDVGCIAARSGLGRFETYKILYSFLMTGLIELRAPRDPALAPLTDGSDSRGNGSASKVGTSSSNRWGAILARLREESDNTPVPESSRQQFDTPVSFLTNICNEIMSNLMTNQDFIVDPSDEKLAERYWRQILMSYPRADLVSASMNTLSSDNFDTYTRTLGVDGPMKSIYLETMEALSRYLRTLYLLSAQRLGSRAARTLFLNQMEALRQRATIGNSEDFFFKEVVGRILE